MIIHTFRGCTKTLLVINTILSLIFICFAIIAGYVFITDETMPPVMRIIFLIVTPLFVFIPGILVLFNGLFNFLKKIQVYEDKLILYSPFKKPRELPVEELSVWGCDAYLGWSTVLFICMADKNTLLSYLHTHRNRCEKIFGKDTVSRLMKTEDGMLTLAVGTYLRKQFFTPKDVFVLECCTPRRLKQMVQAVKKDAIVTGPILLKTKDDWDGWGRYATYDPRD